MITLNWNKKWLFPEGEQRGGKNGYYQKDVTKSGWQ